VRAPLYGPSDKFKPTEDKVISKKEQSDNVNKLTFYVLNA
jgi:hypothetical protein